MLQFTKKVDDYILEKLYSCNTFEDISYLLIMNADLGWPQAPANVQEK